MKEISFVIVDDAVFMRTIIRKMIEQVEGYSIEEGSNGQEAIEAAAQHQPDITL